MSVQIIYYANIIFRSERRCQRDILHRRALRNCQRITATQEIPEAKGISEYRYRQLIIPAIILIQKFLATK